MTYIDAKELREILLVSSTGCMKDHQKDSCVQLAAFARGWCEAIDVAIRQIDRSIAKEQEAQNEKTS